MTIKEYLYSLKGKLILFISLVLIATSFYFAYNYYFKMMNEAKEIEKTIEKKAVKKEETEVEIIEDNKDYYVDIKGQVINPGVYGLKKGSRVINVIELAGGLKNNADTSLINLSMPISDGMLIMIYSKEQVLNIAKTKEEESLKEGLCNENIVNDACANKEEVSRGKININTATLEELSSLNGIGAAKAQAIIDYRNTKAFSSIEELLNVSGIGDALYAQISQDITI